MRLGRVRLLSIMTFCLGSYPQYGVAMLEDFEIISWRLYKPAPTQVERRGR